MIILNNWIKGNTAKIARAKKWNHWYLNKNGQCKKRGNMWLVGFGASKIGPTVLTRFQRDFSGYTVLKANLARARDLFVEWGELDALQAFDKLSHNVMRADLFKYVALYNTGGFYMDLKAGFQPSQDVRCLERMASTSWFALNRSGKVTTWNMFAVRGSSLFAFVKSHIIADILRGREPRGQTFEQKVWDTTGPAALHRILEAYKKEHGKPNTQPSEAMCLVYDTRGSGASWLDPDSYHAVNSNKNVYVSKPE